MKLTVNRFKDLGNKLPITRGGYENYTYYARVMSAEDFIKQHKHVNYCECLILPDGRVVEVKPSHTIVIDSLLDWLYGKSFNLHPGWYEEERLYYTGAVNVWFDRYNSFAKLTKLQERTLLMLRNKGVISSNSEGYCYPSYHQERAKKSIKEQHELREKGLLLDYNY